MAQTPFYADTDDAVLAEEFTRTMTAGDTVGLGLAVSIFADRDRLRAELREDAEGAGFRLAQSAPVGALNAQGVDGLAGGRSLGDIVLVDCPLVDAAALAALARLDERAAAGGIPVVVSTSVDALDDIFACMDRSDPQILVAPGRAERLIVLAQVLTRLRSRRVRELSETDRMVLLRLTEQVSELGSRLESWGAQPSDPALSGLAGAVQAAAAKGAFGFAASGETKEPAARELGPTRAPDPRLIRRLLRQRQLRAKYFPAELFADPAWDMLLDLTAARAERTRVSVTSLCIASGVPPTTALRWIAQMTEAGLLQREEDRQDRRRAFIALTDQAADAMADYFAACGPELVSIS